VTKLDDFYSEGELIPRPECKALTSLERVIALGKPDSVILKFAELVNNDIQWKWFDKYKQYELDHADWTEAKKNFEPVEVEDEYNPVRTFTTFTDIEPVEPERPAIMTAEQLIAPYYKARRISAYPDISEFADAFVKSQNGDNSQLEKYVANCLDVKDKYPKGES